jgi:hypothetical protein
MTVFIPLIVAVALGLAFVAYKHPGAYRVMFMFGFPVLVMGALLVAAIKIGDLNGSIKSIYHELQHIQKDAVSDQLVDQIRKLYQVRQSLKLLLIYYISGFVYLVFLFFLRDILDLAKDRHHTPT